MIARRALLGLGGTMILAAASCGDPDVKTLLRFGSGQADGVYLEFARLLAAAARASGRIRIDPIATPGSRDNLRRLDLGEFDMVLALADSVDDEATAADLAIGRIYENYLQFFVRRNDAIARVEDLRGKTAVLGADGSGAALTGDRLLRAAGLLPGVDTAICYLSLPDSVAALESGRVDAVLWADGVPTEALDIPSRMRLLDLGELVAPLRAAYGDVYQRVRIPADAYRGAPSRIDTIGIANLLMVTRRMPDAAAAAIVSLLLSRSDTLIPAEAVGTQFLDERSLIDTGRIRLHPGAARAYRKWHG